MLNRIILYSLRNKYTVLFVSLLLLVWGTRTAMQADIDVFPDLTAPTVVVLTDAHGMAAEEVERLVTYPIETVVNGATGVRRVRSVSSGGFSFVWVELDWGTDVYRARQVVSEKMVSIAGQMPSGADQPMLAPQASIMGEILFVGLQSDSTSLMDLRTMAEWKVKPLLLATGGVAQVTILGGEYKEYQVLAKPDAMMLAGVSMHELAETVEGMSQNSSGNVARDHGNEYMIRGIGRTSDLDELGNTYIKHHGNSLVRVNDVAEVVIGHAVKMGEGSLNARPAVILSISKQPQTNTLELTRALEANLQALKAGLPPDIILDTKVFRQADFIETSIRNVQTALLEGAVFVVIVLLLFLGSIRTTLISLISIPLSLLGAIVVLDFMGININTMSLGGMAIAVGSLVDDAIIDVENVYKRLRQNHLKPDGEKQPVLEVVYEASREIRASILNATLIIMVAFVPLFFLSGMEGRMLKPLGIAYIVSLFFSLLVAMTLTPLLCKILVSGPRYLERNQKEKWFSRVLSGYYRQSLDWAIRHGKPVILASLILLVVSVIAVSTMGRGFLPEFNEGSLTISAVCKPGTSLAVSDALGTLIEQELLEVEGVTSTARRTGRGELDEHSQAVNSSEIDVNFELEGRDRQEFLEDVRARLSGIPGVAYTVGQPLGHRIDHMLSGTRANIAIKIFGQDLNQLFVLGNRVSGVIESIPGLVDLNVEQQIAVPQVQIRPNREMLAYHGISMTEFNHLVEIAFAGKKLGEIHEDEKKHDLVLKLDAHYSSRLEKLGTVLMDTRDGGKVPLSEVAEILSVAGPSAISRENVQRKIVVSANVAKRDILGVVNDIRDRVEQEVTLPEGYRVEYGGQFESEARASRLLLWSSLLAILVIFMLLYQEFKQGILAGIILLNLPLALIGGVFALWVSQSLISIPSIIGFITLFGIATRNGILLVSRYQSLRAKGMPIPEVIRKGSSDRLNPILMTALTAALALVPLAIQGDLPGNEIQSPMAVVILGGLLSSTLLNIYVIPIVYGIVVDKQKES